MKYTEILEQLINEINMSPSSLRQLAADIDARAGMEFEMIIPELGLTDDDDYEPEMDMDADERVRSFDEIEDFFSGENSRNQIRNAIQELQEEYQDWKMDAITQAWDSEGMDFLRDYIENNDEFDRDEALDKARDEIIDANPDLPTESEDFQKLLSARIDELQEEFVQETWEDGIRGNSRIYDGAFEEYTEEMNDRFEESEFFDDNYRYMSDIQEHTDLSWPYWTQPSEGDNSSNIASTADSFKRAIGRPVNWSTSYHAAQRAEGTYVVEPDGSLEGDNVGDSGLEFVSPPLPIDELLSDLKLVKEWADGIGAYTNDSTGLHINVSVPGFSMEKLDYVKLAILLGDERVLNEFGRMGNTYTQSAFQIVKKNIQNRPEDAQALLDKMKSHLSTAAAKVIHSGTTSKYTSINTKSGYIEFRSPGGDWLNANFDIIEPTLLRFVVALDAALDETKYKQEYAKKLYKLLAPGSKEPGILELFANYAAGELDKEALIRQVRQQQLARNLSKGKIPAGQKYWWNVQWDNNRRMEVVAGSKEVALQVAAEEWGVPESQLAGARVTPLRPYQEPQALNQTGNWGIWMQGPGRFARAPGQINNNVLRRFPSREAAEQWISQTRSTNSAMRTDIEVREIEPSVQNTGSTTSGNWGVWVPSLDRWATIGNAGPRRFENRAAVEAWIQDYNQRHAGNNLELQAREIEPQQGSGTYTYRVFTTDGNQTVGTFQSDGIQGSTDARIAFRQYLQSIGRNDTTGFDYQEIGRERQQPEFVDTTTQSSRGDLTPRGPGPWEIYRISDNSAVRPLSNTSRPEAEQEARNALGLRGEAPELYGVRTRQQAAPTSNTGSLGSFTGEWKIVDPQGREIHRFGGIGNIQADANRVAIQWLQRNPRHMQAGVEVLPVMD